MKQLPRYPHGHTRLELIVSALVLTSILSVSAAAFTRLSRIWDTTRNFQLASQELSNHLERLTLLPKEQCVKQLDSLSVTPLVQEAIPGCQLRGELKVDNDEVRIVLTLDVNSVTRSEPIVLVGWLDSGVEP